MVVLLYVGVQEGIDSRLSTCILKLGSGFENLGGTHLS